MAPVIYELVSVEQLRPSSRRGVVLLRSDGDADIDAAATFGGPSSKKQRELRDRFDTWIEHAPGQHNDLWFHGFTNTEAYRDCFVFKWREKEAGHRLYGFICHPQPNTNKRFQLCVLTNHGEKPRAKWQTDLSELDIANRTRANRHVLAVISMNFPDQASGTKQWTS